MSPVFTEVIAKKILNRQRDKFTKCGLRKNFDWAHHESKIFPTTTKKKYQKRNIFRKNIGEQTLKYIYMYTDELYDLLLWKVGVNYPLLNDFSKEFE